MTEEEKITKFRITIVITTTITIVSVKTTLTSQTTTETRTMLKKTNDMNRNMHHSSKNSNNRVNPSNQVLFNHPLGITNMNLGVLEKEIEMIQTLVNQKKMISVMLSTITIR